MAAASGAVIASFKLTLQSPFRKQNYRRNVDWMLRDFVANCDTRLPQAGLSRYWINDRFCESKQQEKGGIQQQAAVDTLTVSKKTDVSGINSDQERLIIFRIPYPVPIVLNRVSSPSKVPRSVEPRVRQRHA